MEDSYGNNDDCIWLYLDTMQSHNHGRGIAEMPFITTDEPHRRKGVCRILMREIEKLLCSLEVKNLFIPSNVETAEMWKGKFNFNVVNNNNREMKKAISS